MRKKKQKKINLNSLWDNIRIKDDSKMWVNPKRIKDIDKIKKQPIIIQSDLKFQDGLFRFEDKLVLTKKYLLMYDIKKKLSRILKKVMPLQLVKALWMVKRSESHVPEIYLIKRHQRTKLFFPNVELFLA